MLDDELGKQKAQYRAQAAACKTTGSVGCENQASPSTQACEAEPLLWRLLRQEAASARKNAQNRRAIDILERHPEFEELLELIRIVGF